MVEIAGVSFKNPVITASGTWGMGDVFEDFIDYREIGGITLKTVTMQPREGNRGRRILETPAGLLNSIGLENDGFEAVYRELRQNNNLKKIATNVIFSIAGDTAKDFAEMAAAFSKIEGVDMLELNLSCPNVHDGGRTFDSDSDVVRQIVSEVGKISSLPFSTKLSPNADIIAAAKAAQEAGSPVLTISNTYLGMAFDLKSGEPVFKNKVAGFSGPAVKPMALYNVWRVSNAVNVPIIASGGIASADDAREFFFAGASLVSIGTFNFVEPDIAAVIARELEDKDNRL